MIHASSSSDHLIIDKISIVDAKKVNYTNFHVLNRKPIHFDDADAVMIKPLPEDVKFPASSKLTDSGSLFNYKISISINNQSAGTHRQLESFLNKKVICVLHTNQGYIIIGVTEQPLTFLYEDDNTTSAASFNGFSVTLSGNTYYCKVKA